MSISIRNVAKSFGTTLAIEDVSFDLTENSFVSIVGPSGCGKSTLLRLVAGLIPPSGGAIMVRDRPVERPLRDIGMVFQSPVLLPWRTTLGNILFVAEMGGLRASAHRTRAADLINLAGLAGFVKNYPHVLSGGLRLRACNLLASLLQSS